MAVLTPSSLTGTTKKKTTNTAQTSPLVQSGLQSTVNTAKDTAIAQETGTQTPFDSTRTFKQDIFSPQTTTGQQTAFKGDFLQQLQSNPTSANVALYNKLTSGGQQPSAPTSGRELPSTTPAKTPSTITEAAQAVTGGTSQSPQDDFQAAYDKKREGLVTGMNDYVATLQDSLTRSEDFSVDNINRLSKSYDNLNRNLDDTIDDLKQSRNTLSGLYDKSRDINLEQAGITQEGTLSRMDLAQQESRDNFDSAIEEQAAAIDAKRVRDETFAGLRGNFGSSASLESIDAAEAQGRDVLNSLYKDAARSEQLFGINVKEIQDSYLSNIRSINNDADTKLQKLFAESNEKIAAIQADKGKNDVQKAQAINAEVSGFDEKQSAVANTVAKSVFDLNNTLAEDTINLKKDQIAEEQRGIENQIAERTITKEEKYTDANIQNMQQGFDLAQQKFEQSKQETSDLLEFQKEKQAFEEVKFANSLQQNAQELELAWQKELNDQEQQEVKNYLDRANLELDIAKIEQAQEKINQDKAEFEQSLEKASTGDFGSETTLRKEFNALDTVKNFKEIDRQYSIMENAYDLWQNDPTVKSLNAIDQAIGVVYQKMLDPTSVVRESEFARTTAGQSLLAQVEGRLKAWKDGGIGLGDAERENLVKMASALHDAASNKYVDDADYYMSLANDYGFNGDRIIDTNIVERAREKTEAGEILNPLDVDLSSLQQVDLEQIDSLFGGNDFSQMSIATSVQERSPEQTQQFLQNIGFTQ